MQELGPFKADPNGNPVEKFLARNAENIRKACAAERRAIARETRQQERFEKNLAELKARNKKGS